jgi:hypothetical protein
MDYERGLEQLKQYLKGTDYEQEFFIYEARLRENLDQEGVIKLCGDKRSC